MDNRDKEEFINKLNAILASAYSGGNSFAARKARAEVQNRDDKGQFAEMYGEMRLVMLKNGITPVAMIARFVGSVGDGSNDGWFYVPEGDKNFASGFYRFPVDRASSDIVARLDESYLEGKGVKPGQAQGQVGMLNVEDLEFTSVPPDFIEHPDIDGAFISEDGDITIERNDFDGWDVVDNIDPANEVQSVDDLGEAMKAVHAIDMTRKDYVPTEWDAKVMADAQLSGARNIAAKTPVATLPATEVVEAPKADPAGMTNKAITEELAQFARVYGGANGFRMDEETKARYEAVDAEQELRIEENENQFDNPDFIRDPSKSQAPIAEIPTGDVTTPEGISEDELAELRELQRRAIADGGLSISFAEGAAPTDGFMVSFEGKDNDLGIISKADFEDAEKGPKAIFDFLMDNQEFLDGEGNFFGVWFDNDENIYDTDGNVIGTKPEAERNPRYFLDVSQNVADRQEAIDLGIERNQKAIWDVIKQESISTGGTGERKEDGTDSTPGGEDGSGSDGDSKDSLGESEQEVTTVEPGVYFDQNRTVDPDFFEPAASRSRSRSSKLNAALRRATKFANDAKAFAVPGWSWKSRTDFDNFWFEYQKDAQGLRAPSQEQIADTVAHVDKAIEYLVSQGYVLQVGEKNPSGTHKTIKVLAGPGQPYEPKGGDGGKPPVTPVTPVSEDDEFNVKSDADLLTGDVAEKIVDFIARGDEQAVDRVGNLYLSTDLVEDAGMQWIVSYEDADGNTREFVGSLPVDTAGNILQSVDVRAEVLDEIEAQSKEMDATPASVNITDPNQILEGEIFDTIATFVEQGFENSAEFGNVKISAVPDYLSDENTLSIFVEYTDADGNIREYTATYPLSENDGIIVGANETAREAVYSDLKAQIDAESSAGSSPVDEVKKDIEDGTPIVGETDVPAGTDTETVTEISAPPVLKMGRYTLNSVPTANEVRRAKKLDGVSDTDLQDALAKAIADGSTSIDIGGVQYPTRVVVVALSSRGFDVDMFIAQKLDEKNGNTNNVDALTAYRAQNPEVTGEGTDNAKPVTLDEALSAFIAGTSQQELVSIYTDAVQNNKDSVSVSLENFGAPEDLGSKIVDIPLADFRKRLVDAGIDMDSVDNGFKGNEKTKEDIAKEIDATPEELEPVLRTDWREAIFMGTSDYNTIRFVDEDGITREYVRAEDGKWYDSSKSRANKRNVGLDDGKMVRLIERDADRDEPLEITNGSGYDESGDLIDEAKNAFSFSSPEESGLTQEEAAEVARWRHITYGDLKSLRKLQKSGFVVDIMDKMQEIFPNAERRGEDELVTESHEWTDPATGNKMRFEVVVTKTPNEYYYTYVRRINLTKKQVWSSRAGRMNQSALGLFRTHRREMAKFHASFFKPGGPNEWFGGKSTATYRRMKKDQFDESTGTYIHDKDLQLDRNTTAMILNLLGATPSSTQEVDRADDLVMREIFRNLSKHRYDDAWMIKSAKRISKRTGRVITPEYLYKVSEAYDQHIINQQNLTLHGEWVSWDQKTPVDMGDSVEWVASFNTKKKRSGVIQKRLGWARANGGYLYTDYVLVRWDNGRFQITPARNVRLIETADGTDGSERVKYNEGFEDPRTDYGTEFGDPARVLIPQPVVVPAPSGAPQRQTASRNENSELVLEDGTVVPERLINSTPTATLKHPSKIVVGDYISLLNDDLEPIQAPVLSNAVSVEGSDIHTVDVAIRQADGTYQVQKVSLVAGPNEFAQVVNYASINPATGVSAGQMNELMELLGSKELPDRPISELTDFYLGVLEGKDMSSVYSAEEVADIIQELRALPDRTPTPTKDAAELAREAAAEAERSGNPDASQQLAGLADDADIIDSQTGTTSSESESESSDSSSLASRVAEASANVNLGAISLKSEDRKALPPNGNPSNVKIEGTSLYQGTKPTEEASALKDKMLQFGAEAWEMAKKRVIDELRQRGYAGIKNYDDVETARTALTDASDEVYEAATASLTAEMYGYDEPELRAVRQEMANNGYIRESTNTIDTAKVRELAQSLGSDAPGLDKIYYPYTQSGATLLYLFATRDDFRSKVEDTLRSQKKAMDELEKYREQIKKFNKDAMVAHDKSTIDTLKELGVEFDNVSMSALGIRSSYGGSSITERGEMGKAIEEAFKRVPRAILLQLAEIMKNNKMQLVVAPTKGRGHMSKRSGHYKIAVSREHGRSQGGIQFESAYENPYTDVFLHELWHVIQEVSPNVAQLEHAWLYDRLVSKDKDGNDVLPRLASATGSTRLGKEKGFSTVNGFVSNYLLKQYGERGMFGDPNNFFSPNNKYSEVATMVMQDIFGHNGQSSAGDGMIVYSSKHNGRAFAASSTGLFQDESTGKWYTDKAMTDEIKNAKTYGRPVKDFDEQVKHFGLGLLMIMSDWSPTQGLGTTPRRKTYNASDLFFDEETGKWYTDSSKTTEVNSADVRGRADGV